MARKYFGTDGVRGRANVHPMTADFAVKLATAVGYYFARDAKQHRVVIGKDTRRSSYMFESALTAGFTAAGMDVFVLGPMPTPAVGRMTHSMRADLGVMISASHNPFHDNGIKFFGPDGFKLSDAVELEIENLLQNESYFPNQERIGRVTALHDAQARYVEFAKTTLPGNLRLDGLKVVLDCANGAAYKVAPEVLWELGAEVITVGNTPNGRNINENCGSTSPEKAGQTVRDSGADVGICLDGDADRIIILDENGQVADGDQLMALIATSWAEQGKLKNNTLVSTVMSNLGLERYLFDHGLSLKRTPVGDRYVVEEMRAGGFNLGGEQSGHIVMTDYATTGDGLVAGLQFLHMLKERGVPASVLANRFEAVPQMLKNVRFTKGATPLESSLVKKAIDLGNEKLGADGRLLIRESGTEPLIRVMGESLDATLLENVVNDIAQAVASAG